ncbi:MAG: RICIN domain-containing protein [Coriobacteriales bacterium]|nr:RICIN domain-containing protein [Coriobacteriales bacterium]
MSQKIRRDKVSTIAGYSNLTYMGWGWHGGITIVPDDNHSPYGYFDVVKSDTGKVYVYGWAKDPDDENAQLTLHVYVGGDIVGGEGHIIRADVSRSDVGAHGFSSWLDTGCSGSTEVHVYAINVGAGDNAQLTNSPRTVIIPSDSEKPKITDVSVYNLTPSGYDVSCKVTDNVGVSCVRFPTWTSHSVNGNDQDDIRWDEQAHGNGTYTYHVKVNDHNGECGVWYHTHIYAYDRAGNVTAVGPAVNIPVPHAMANLNGKTYLRMDAGVSDYHSWSEAQRWCERSYFSGRLACITSEEQLRAVEGLITSSSSENIGWWIGASDTEIEGTWKWVSGELVGYSRWRFNEPNGGTGENVAAMYKEDCKWVDLKDQAYSSSIGYIMEVEGMHSRLGEIVTDLDEGVYTINCFDQPGYSLDVTEGSTESGANIELWTDNGTDAQRFQFTRNYVETNEGRVSDGTYTITNVKSGMALDVAYGQLTNGSNVQQHTLNGTLAQRWYVERGDGGCYYLRSAVNDLYLDIQGATFADGINVITHSGHGDTNQRFRLVRAEHPKLVSAQLYDVNPDGYSIRVELKSTEKLKGVSFATWTLNDLTKHNDSANQDDVLWTAGTVDGSTAIVTINVSDHNGEHGVYRTHIYARDVYGNHYNVGGLGYVLVPDAIAATGAGSYFLMSSSATWTAAQAACEEYGALTGLDAHLVTIGSKDEQAVISELVKGGSKDNYWIGATDKAREGTWVWATGERFGTYTNWASGEPDGGTSENSVAIERLTGIWRDHADGAHGNFGYVVEVEGDDRVAPVISDVRVTDLDETGYTVSCVVDDPSGVDRVEFPTWAVSNGDDGSNVAWPKGDLYVDSDTGQTVAEFRVSVADHGGVVGEYGTHIYAWDAKGNRTNPNGEAQSAGVILVPNASFATEGSLFYRYDSGTTWTESKRMIDDLSVEGVQFASIESAAEQDAVSSLIAGGGKAAYWLGLKKSSGAFSWTDGTNSSYTHWASGQPANSTTYGAVLASNASWYAYADAGVNGNTSQMGFIAKVRYGDLEEVPVCTGSHTWSAWITVSEATCSKEGLEERYCENCWEYETRAISKLAHTSGAETHENEVSATCDMQGSYDAVVRCKVCGTVISRTKKTTSALGHVWDGGVVTTNPTCTTTGVHTFTCSRCNATRTESIQKIGHTPGAPVSENISEADSCLHGGSFDEVVYCTMCHTELSRTHKEQPAGEHMPVTDPAVAPTCTSDGLTEGSHCQVCGTVFVMQEIVPATGHKVKNIAAVPATCTTAGVSAGTRCETCGRTLSGCTAVAALGHNYKDTVVAPTCTAPGHTDHVCTRCGNSYADAQVQATGHVAGATTYDNEVPATCKAAGHRDAVVRCSVCGKEMSRTTQTLPVIAHSWDGGKVTTNATCTVEGVRTYACAACGTTRTEKIAMLSHSAKPAVRENIVNPTCTAAGHYDSVIRCATCNKEMSRQQVEVTALGHSWGAWEVAREATTSREGLMIQTCSACGVSQTKTIPKLQLVDISDATISKIPTQTFAGKGLEPPTTIKLNGSLLTAGVDYNATFKNNVNVGTATVTVTGKGAFKGSVSATFRIAPKEVVVTANDMYKELGEEDPKLTATVDGTVGGDKVTYRISRRAGEDVGSYTIRVTGEEEQGNYLVSYVSGRLTITERDISGAEVAGIANMTYDGTAKRPSPKVTLDGVALKKSTDYTVSYKNNVNAGTATVVFSGINDYAGSVKKTFRIDPMPIVPIVKLSKASYVYNGKAQRPSPSVSVGSEILDEDGYSVNYTSGCKAVGEYVVKVDLAGNYSGSASVGFSIVPKGTVVSKLTPASKAITVTWKKQATQTTGYQVQYGAKKSFKGAKSVTVAKPKATSKKISKLISQKTYYVRVRTYKKVGGKMFYSAWSAVKSAKAK